MMKRVITIGEIQVLKKYFGEVMPAKLLKLLSQRQLIGDSFRLSEMEDVSGFGVEMQWMTPDEQIEEAFKFYPGISALGRGYVPVGICLLGSGNPYFIKEVNDVLGLYRILHEAAVDDDLDESQVEYVCSVNDLVGEE